MSTQWSVLVGQLVVVFIFQLVLAVPTYFLLRKRLAAIVIGLIVFLIVLGFGTWIAERMVANTLIRDYAEAVELHTETDDLGLAITLHYLESISRSPSLHKTHQHHGL